MAQTRHGLDYLQDTDRTPTSATAFRVLAAVSRGLIRNTASLAAALPPLWHQELHLQRPGTTLAAGVQRLKDKAVDLIKDELLANMRELQTRADEFTDEERGARKNQIKNTLARLTRRTQTIALQAMQDADGTIATDPKDNGQDLDGPLGPDL